MAGTAPQAGDCQALGNQSDQRAPSMRRRRSAGSRSVAASRIIRTILRISRTGTLPRQDRRKSRLAFWDGRDPHPLEQLLYNSYDLPELPSLETLFRPIATR